MKLIILGSGTSTGVPVIGCTCDVCASKNKKNRRNRASVMVRGTDNFSVLVDTGPDLRRQMIKYRISSLDRVLYTHYHYDHLGGLNDLRPFCFHKKYEEPLFCMANEQTYQEIKRLYPYAFKKSSGNHSGPSNQNNQSMPRQVELDFKIFSFNDQRIYESFQIEKLKVQPIRLMHIPKIKMECVGFVFNDKIGYLTDFKYILPEYDPFLYNLDVLILGAPLYREHPTHISIPEGFELIQKYKPKKGVISHLSHEFSHDDLEKKFPEGTTPAYDGMSFNFLETLIF